MYFGDEIEALVAWFNVGDLNKVGSKFIEFDAADRNTALRQVRTIPYRATFGGIGFREGYLELMAFLAVSRFFDVIEVFGCVPRRKVILFVDRTRMDW